MGTFATDGESCRDLICLSCPNGCHLAIDVRGNQCLELQGNGCEMGLEFARSFLDVCFVRRYAREPSVVRGEEKLKEIAGSWGISVKAVRPRMIPAGAPSVRSSARSSKTRRACASSWRRSPPPPGM